jgi:hypothetical protein
MNQPARLRENFLSSFNASFSVVDPGDRTLHPTRNGTAACDLEFVISAA